MVILKAFLVFLVFLSIFSIVGAVKVIHWIGYPPPKTQAPKKMAPLSFQRPKPKPQPKQTGIRYIRVKQEESHWLRFFLQCWVTIPALITICQVFLYTIWRIAHVLY